jgi:hypothetical protein
MRHATYVSGWRFDWQEARRDCDRYMAVGREIAAAACADPGCVSCPACGESHWREFEVFICARCGAEVTMNLHKWTDVKAGPPAKPEECRQKFRAGMRVRWHPKEITRRGKPNTGGWRAGPVPLGTCGTVRKDPDSVFSNNEAGWLIEWDGLTPKHGCQWGSIGPWMDDDLEVLPESQA